MKERPILFSGPMVRAILAGTKTQTRRVVSPKLLSKAQGLMMEGEEGDWCPNGQPGDRLWARETFGLWCHSFESVGVEYAAGGDDLIVDFPGKVGMPPLEVQCQKNRGGGRRKRPSIYMPRWASRITLEITEVRVQRVQEISEDDAKSEGVARRLINDPMFKPDAVEYGCGGLWGMNPRQAFQWLWDGINQPRGFGWDKNPWVWAITFRKI